MKLRRQVNVILIGAMLGLVLRGSHRHSNGRIGSGLAGLSFGIRCTPVDHRLSRRIGDRCNRPLASAKNRSNPGAEPRDMKAPGRKRRALRRVLQPGDRGWDLEG